MFTREQWSRAFLAALGNPSPNLQIVQFVVGWTAFETNANSGARYNLLNTTWDMQVQGQSDFNSVHVKNYPDWKTGIDANVRTIKNGLYTNLESALRANIVAALAPIESVILQELSKWCGGCGYGAGFIAAGSQHALDRFDYGSAPSQQTGPTANQRSEAIDSWNSFFGTLKSFGVQASVPPVDTGIFKSWLDEWTKGRYRGCPITWEYNSHNWDGKSIKVQEFASGRCEWDGSPHWISF